MPEVKDKIIHFLEHANKNSFAQSKDSQKWMIDHGYSELVRLMGKDMNETKINFYRFAYGHGVCKHCNSAHEKLLVIKGWKGWSLTCSEECRQKLASERQMGSGNSSHKMTPNTRIEAAKKQSLVLKNKILNGTFTPKTSNYKTFGMIEFRHNGEIRKVRSLWELLFWIENEDFKYEKIRLKYFDPIEQRERIYITDFYDETINKIIEVKPKKYQDIRYHSKRQACIDNGFEFEVLDETYFSKFKKDAIMLEKLEECVINFDKIKGRLKWLKTKKEE